jgi:hypothetical protein
VLGPEIPNLFLISLATVISALLLVVAQRLFALFDTVLADVI